MGWADSRMWWGVAETRGLIGVVRIAAALHAAVSAVERVRKRRWMLHVGGGCQLHIHRDRTPTPGSQGLR